jgi:DNA-binding response OmpR family regulator
MVHRRIVIIEDDPDIADIMKYALEQEGYTVQCLCQIDSLEDLIDMHADCFILDEWLPSVSGHIICIMLKFNQQTKNIPVILTSAGSHLTRVAGLSEPEAILEKPFDIKHMLALVSKVIMAGSKEIV